MIASPRGELKPAEVPVPSALVAVPDPAKVETVPWLRERVVVSPGARPGFGSGWGEACVIVLRRLLFVSAT